MSRVWMINGVLAVVLAVCWINIWDVWQTDTSMLPAAMSGEKIKPPRPFNAPPENAILAAADYHSVVDSNLFSPDRTAPSPEAPKTGAEPAVEEVRISGEKVMLYGVVLFGGYKTALINNPGDQPKGVQNKWVKEGDSIANVKVQEIHSDQVILSDSEGSYRVLLYDPKKESKASSPPKSAPASQPKVVSVGDAPTAAKPAAKVGAPALVESPKPEKSRQIEKVTISEDGQYEIIDTPLGQIQRKRK